MTPAKIIVCAGHASQATSWAKEMDLPLTRILYATEQSVRGHSNPVFIVIGTFWERPDAIKIWQVLQAAMSSPLHPIPLPQAMLPATVKAAVAAVASSNYVRKGKRANVPDSDLTKQVPQHAEHRFKRISVPDGWCENNEHDFDADGNCRRCPKVIMTVHPETSTGR